MKVAFIHHAFPRLHNTFIVNEIVELLRCGVDVSIYSLSKSGDMLKNVNINGELSARTYYFEDFAANVAPIPASCSKYMARFQQPTESRWRSLFRRQWHRQTRAGLPFATVAQQLADNQYDIIHGAFGNRPATAALILSEMTGIPWTFETHAFDLFVDFPFAASKFEKADRIFTESQYHRAYLENELHAPPHKLEVMHLSPDRVMLDGIQRTERMNNRLVSVCRLHPIKGLIYALQAVAMARHSFPQLEYIIIGDGPLANDLRAEVTRLNLNDCVHFAGSMTNVEACKVMQTAGVFLLPSVIACNGDRDGTPTAIAEAMQLEIPVVSTNISGIPELVVDGVTGILVPPGDVGATAQALTRLLGDSALCKKMGRAGKERVLSEFDVTRNAQQLLSAWEAIAALQCS